MMNTLLWQSVFYCSDLFSGCFIIILHYDGCFIMISYSHFFLLVKIWSTQHKVTDDIYNYYSRVKKTHIHFQVGLQNTWSLQYLYRRTQVRSVSCSFLNTGASIIRSVWCHSVFFSASHLLGCVSILKPQHQVEVLPPESPWPVR